MSTLGEEIIQGLREAVAYAKGEADVAAYGVHIPEEIDVRKLRGQLRMTQKKFAASFGLSLTTVRHWEQRLRKPEGPARAYLTVISRRPDQVREALEEAGRAGGPAASSSAA